MLAQVVPVNLAQVSLRGKIHILILLLLPAAEEEENLVDLGEGVLLLLDLEELEFQVKEIQVVLQDHLAVVVVVALLLLVVLLHPVLVLVVMEFNWQCLILLVFLHLPEQTGLLEVEEDHQHPQTLETRNKDLLDLVVGGIVRGPAVTLSYLALLEQQIQVVVVVGPMEETTPQVEMEVLV
jgi:hypothetical protein